MHAAAAGHTNVVALLLQQKADLEACSDKQRESAISLAASAGFKDVCQLILKHAAPQAPSQGGQGGQGVSQNGQAVSGVQSVQSGQGGQAQGMQGVGADVFSPGGLTSVLEHRNTNDYTPLCCAAMGGHLDVVQLLHDCGAEINARTNTKLG